MKKIAFERPCSFSLLFLSNETEADRWDSTTEPCEQTRFNDLTGVDSLAAPVVGLIVFLAVQFLERNGPLVDFDKNGVMIPYLKKGQGFDELEEREDEKAEQAFQED